MTIIPNNVHESWNGLLDEETLIEIKEIESKIGDNINPKTENVMRFLQNDLNKVKVVILGQDPYPEKGRATGRSFEVGDLFSWNDKFRQVSLKNIIRLIHKDYTNTRNYDNIKKFSQIQKDIASGEFDILSPQDIFKSWEDQGVLMLNTYLTVESGNPGSHIKIWQDFSCKLLRYISLANKEIKWFLWGKQAEKASGNIIHGKKYISRHPMMCSSKYEDDFLKSNCFKNTMEEINWLGKKK